jgi:hypothetical protein
LPGGKDLLALKLAALAGLYTICFLYVVDLWEGVDQLLRLLFGSFTASIG